jgi:hypothetical protein
MWGFSNTSHVSNRTELITQNSGLKSLTGKELVNNQYVINSVKVLTVTHSSGDNLSQEPHA